MKKIYKLITDYKEAFNKAKVDLIKDMFDDNAMMVVDFECCSKGKEQIIATIEEMLKSNLKIDVTKVKPFIVQNSALVIINWVMKGESKDSVITKSYTAASVFCKQFSGEWKILITHPFLHP